MAWRLTHDFLICKSTCDLTDVQALIWDTKMDARSFDSTQNILRCLSFVQSLFKVRHAPIWRIGNRRVNGIELKIFFTKIAIENRDFNSYAGGTAPRGRLTFKDFLAIFQLSNLFDPKNLYPRKRLLQHMYLTDYRQNLLWPRKN